jgi:hypothetical protein
MKINPLVVVLLTMAVASCGGDAASAHDRPSGVTSPTAPSSVQTGPFDIEVTRLRVFIKEGRPQAYVEAPLGDSCNALQQIVQRREGNAFHITITAKREGEMCAQLMQYVNEWLPLIGPFRAGAHTIEVNGARVEFQLVVRSGGLQIDPDPGPLPSMPFAADHVGGR